MDMTGYDNWYFNSRAYVIPPIVADLIILYAGYNFAVVGASNPAGYKSWLGRLFGKRESAPEPVSSIDIIDYVAGMAAEPRKIDPYLDKLRIFTAKMTPGYVITSNDQQTLEEIYLNIEHALVTGNSLRNLTQPALREEIKLHFLLANADRAKVTFWPMLRTA
jgi:hypothetical protein